ncbi:IS200/IS605 family accessory protein TnpB-related protein [bacterium]|nr:IS200/IS605 family accessory protein TnpB-related protein [bacterium]
MTKNYNKNKIQQLSLKRNNKINDYIHKSSRYLVNHLVSNNISKLIIGYNKEWKQETNMSKQNNQNFVQIPYLKLINLIKYKCELEGIDVIIREESYTSKCSFLDNEQICKHNKYLGKRIKRGLFKTFKGLLINADINASLNILRKEVPNAFNNTNGIEVCSMPSVFTVKL